MKFRIFISSVQDEFASERRKLKDWLGSDPFISRFVESVFLFEDVPAKGCSPVDVYLDEVKGSDIYIGLIGSQYYGRNSVKRGVSATEREYAAAVSVGVECWVYLSNVEKRDKKTEALVKKVGSAATWAKYAGFPELRDAVFSSFVDFLDKRHLLVVSDFAGPDGGHLDGTRELVPGNAAQARQKIVAAGCVSAETLEASRHVEGQVPDQRRSPVVWD